MDINVIDCLFSFSYSVIVRMVESQSLEAEESNTGIPCQQLTWPQLCGVSRVSGHAAKVYKKIRPQRVRGTTCNSDISKLLKGV